MTSISKTGWLVPAGLLLLCAVPVAAGFARLVMLASTDPTPGNIRFFAAPAPVVIHILTACLYAVLGVFQFVPNFRYRHPTWHRTSGRLLVVSGAFVVLSGLWMTQTYPWPPLDGEVLYMSRLIVGAAMFLFIWLGVNAISQRRIPSHRAWMIRAYALGMGAGTQVLTHIPVIIWPEILTETTRWIMMDAGWVINIVIAEIIILKPRRRAILQGA